MKTTINVVLLGRKPMLRESATQIFFDALPAYLDWQGCVYDILDQDETIIHSGNIRSKIKSQSDLGYFSGLVDFIQSDHCSPKINKMATKYQSNCASFILPEFLQPGFAIKLYTPSINKTNYSYQVGSHCSFKVCLDLRPILISAAKEYDNLKIANIMI